MAHCRGDASVAMRPTSHAHEACAWHPFSLTRAAYPTLLFRRLEAEEPSRDLRAANTPDAHYPF